MSPKSPDRLLADFRRQGQRTYREARRLLEAFGFSMRKRRKHHEMWTHGSIYLVLDPVRDLKTYAKQEVIRAIEAIGFDDE